MLQEISKISLEEKRKNELILYQFQLSFLSGTFSSLDDILDEKGIYFRRMNKARAIAYLFGLLHNDENRKKFLWVEVKYGYSYDHIPGEHVIEIRYMDPDPSDLPETTEYKFGDKPREFLKEVVHRFALQITKGKITRIRTPKKVIESIGQLELNN
jgi:hypothetical protein